MKVLVFLGSVRDSSPPLPKRLGARVAQACIARLKELGCDACLIDPLELDLSRPFKPHFAHASGKAPPTLETLANQIADADGFVMVSPEYNHSMSPALADLLNHFGSSLFSFKPSAIVTYSAGQWGGARAAVNMRTYLSELGCLPVSAMIHVPKAQEVFEKDGSLSQTQNSAAWSGYADRTWRQLIWWAEAAKTQRVRGLATDAFDRDPSQRNAP